MNKLAQYIQTMVGTGVLIPDDELETYVREAANLPPKVANDERFIDPDREDQQTNDLGSQGNGMYTQRTIRTLPKMMERYRKPRND